MFTGIVREIGTVTALSRSGGLLRVGITAPKTASRVGLLESVSVSGVCLSVVALKGSTLTFEVVPETQRLTTLAALKPGYRVNLEPALTVTDRLSGHLVFGHVDGLGVIASRKEIKGELVLIIRADPVVRRYLVSKGPITVDGVSLTVGSRITGNRFSLHLIPETLRQTTLAERRAGDKVNLEADYLAKLVEQFVRGRKR